MNVLNYVNMTFSFFTASAEATRQSSDHPSFGLPWR